MQGTAIGSSSIACGFDRLLLLGVGEELAEVAVAELPEAVQLVQAGR